MKQFLEKLENNLKEAVKGVAPLQVLLCTVLERDDSDTISKKYLYHKIILTICNLPFIPFLVVVFSTSYFFLTISFLVVTFILG